MNKIHLATPTPRDNKERPPIIPTSVIQSMENMEIERREEEKTEEEIEDEERPEWMRGLGSQEWKKKYLLENEEWKFDIIPEIKNGHNIADYIDPEILEKLNQLEEEEDEREKEMGNQMEDEEDLDDLNEEEKGLLGEIREKKSQLILDHILERGHNHPSVPDRLDPEGERTIGNFESHLRELGIDPTLATKRLRSRSRDSSRVGRKRTRSEDPGEGDDSKIQKRSSKSRTPAPPHQLGLKDIKQQQRALSLTRKAQTKRNKEARKGEGDRHVPDLKPKHLFSGQRGLGTNDRSKFVRVMRRSKKFQQ